MAYLRNRNPSLIESRRVEKPLKVSKAFKWHLCRALLRLRLEDGLLCLIFSAWAVKDRFQGLAPS